MRAREAVGDNHILRGAVGAGFQADGIVVGIDHAVAHHHIGAGINVAPVVVAKTIMIENIESPQAHLHAFEVVLHPKARIAQAKSLDHHILAFHEEDVPGHRCPEVPRPHHQQAPLPVDGAGAAQADAFGLVGEEEGSHAVAALVERHGGGIVMRVIGDVGIPQQDGPGLEVEMDVVAQFQSAGEVAPCGKNKGAAARAGAVVDKCLDGPGVRGGAVGHDAVFEDIDHGIGFSEGDCGFRRPGARHQQ